MKYVEPDFYSEFQCIADKCRHSCCIGWEIDIDEDSAEYYAGVDGEMGEKLRRCISYEPEPHFVLGENERCPFLKDNGLCEMILTLGEDSLCDICTEHPRFFNDFPERQECGVGLCCEEAVRLLLSGKEPLGFIETDDEDGEREVPELIALRGEIFNILGNQNVPLTERMEVACAIFGMELMPFDEAHWREFYLSLERMDEEWTKIIIGKQSYVNIDEAILERLAEYFIYRHFASAKTMDEAALLLQFSFLSVRFIAALGGNLAETVRLYSAEIEYSDENIALITDEIAKLIQ